VNQGALALTVPAATLANTTLAEITELFTARGIDCMIDIADSDEPLRHVRADLAETTFAADRTPVGV
jgi:hypothetical protein